MGFGPVAVILAGCHRWGNAADQPTSKLRLLHPRALLKLLRCKDFPRGAISASTAGRSLSALLDEFEWDDDNAAQN